VPQSADEVIDHAVILGEFGDHRCELGSGGDDLGKQSAVLGAVVTLQGSTETPAVNEQVVRSIILDRVVREFERSAQTPVH
jgi:hypothetical protein